MRLTSRLPALLLVLTLASPAFPCTTFCLAGGGRLLFGKNYDWHIDSGLLIVNRRGLLKEALPRQEVKGTPARWEARYGSVTFNQYGRGVPSGGMNEAGLVIELMWLEEGRYPAPDARPVVGVLEWIQYQLDTAGSVAEVIASDSAVRIAGEAPLHYLVADRSGASAAVEFLSGKMVAHTGDALPVRTLTNSPYAEALGSYRGAGRPARRGNDSLRRFSDAARRSEAFEAESPADPVAYAFETLEQVGRASTRWSIVYDIGQGEVHFRTGRRPEVRKVRLADLDFACGSAPLAIDLNAPGGGDLSRALRPLTAEENQRFIREAYAGTPFLARAGEAEIRAVASQAETERCGGSGASAR